MNRRTAIAIAVAAGGTALAAGAAFATNVGLLEPEQDQVGQLEPLNVGALLTDDGSPITPQTIVIDVPAPPVAQSGGAGTSQTVPAAGADDSYRSDDDHDEGEDGEGEDGDHEDDDHEDDDHEDADDDD